MVLFAGAGICLWVMIFWSACLTPAAQSRAKVLNICADNAGGGSMVIVRRGKSGGEWTHPAAQHADWTSGKRHWDTARLSNGRRAFDKLLRGPPERGPQRRVMRLSPAFPSPDTVGGYISVNNRNITANGRFIKFGMQGIRTTRAQKPRVDIPKHPHHTTTSSARRRTVCGGAAPRVLPPLHRFVM